MTTKTNLWFLTLVALFVAAIVFGVGGCTTQEMAKLTGKPTPTPTPYAKPTARGPGDQPH